MKRNTLFYLSVLLLGLWLMLSGLAIGAVIIEGDLPRQAATGFAVSAEENGLVVARVEPGTPASESGLSPGDRLLTINGHTAMPAHVGQGLLDDADGGQPLRLQISRDGSDRSITFTPPARPHESIPGMDSHYGVVDMADGSRLRTLIARPEGTRGPMPALFFVQWVSCGSLEYRAESPSRSIMVEVARRSNRVLVRVERSASGDSQGPRCHELDYDTEIAHYTQAFRSLLKSPHVDPGDVVILGSSLGSTTAPLIARRLQDEGVRWAGIVVQGGGAVTYFERMLQFDRIYLERRPEVSPAGIHQQILDRVRFHTAYLIEGRSPDEIAEDGPAMARVRGDVRGLGAGHHYGRPYAWHQQAARHDFLAAWAALETPALVVFNAYDQFETRHGHRLIVDTVNRLRPGSATFVEQPGIGHSNTLYASAEAAYADADGVAAPQLIIARISEWLAQFRR